MIVIYGPQRTGKTLHRDRFAGFYGCKRIVDDVMCKDRRIAERESDLMLSIESEQQLKRRFPDAQLVPIAMAREAVGLDPIPPAGFPVPPRATVAADPRIKTANGPTILLHSGAYFDLLDPHGSDFTIEDIAHGLSNICRYAGQCSSFYSVAEHSFHTSYLVPEPLRLAALMHDAAEAFIGDVTRPLKSLLPDYKRIESNVEAAIAERFGIVGMEAAEVKSADLAMLAAEQAQIMPDHADGWAVLSGVIPAPVTLRMWTPNGARTSFLLRYRQLTCRRSDLLNITNSAEALA